LEAGVVDDVARGAEEALSEFYRAAVWALSEHVRSSRTAVGFGVVLKRLAVERGVTAAAQVPLPRLSRAEERAVGRDARGARAAAAAEQRHGLGSVDAAPTA
jgi:hypothetical protein